MCFSWTSYCLFWVDVEETVSSRFTHFLYPVRIWRAFLKHSNELNFSDIVAWQTDRAHKKTKKQCSHYRIILHCKTPLHTYWMIHCPDKWSDGVWQWLSVYDEATLYFAGDLNATLFFFFFFRLWLETEHIFEKRRKNLDSTSEFLCNTQTLLCQPA